MYVYKVLLYQYIVNNKHRNWFENLFLPMVADLQALLTLAVGDHAISSYTNIYYYLKQRQKYSIYTHYFYLPTGFLLLP